METESDSLQALGLLLLSLPPAEVLYSLVAVLLLLLASALISGSEVAFFSLTPNDFEDIGRSSDPASQRIMLLREQPRRLLATILISNNFVNIGIVLISDYLIQALLPDETMSALAEGILAKITILTQYFSADYLAKAIGFLLTVVAVTFILLLFGEVMPKVYAGIDRRGLTKTMARPLLLLIRLFHPMSSVLVNATQLIEHRLRRHRMSTSKTSREDIDDAIDLTVKNDDDSDGQELDILKRIVKFSDVTVTQVMRSRLDVVAVDFRLDYAELLRIVRECGYSRLPVYETDLDTVTGLLYVKDLLAHLHEPSDFEWQGLIRTDVLFVPESKRISDLLRDFQRRHLHLGIVVDEYGGTTGIVTLEDILEEVVGDIRDEFDDDTEVTFQKIDDYNYIFEGKTMLNDLCRVLGLDTTFFDAAKGDADSIAGIILEQTGRMPAENEEIILDGYIFRAVKVSARRIEKVLLVVPHEEV